MKILSILGLALIVFVSGCVEGQGLQSLFGSFGETKTAPSDVLLVDSMSVVPNPPITANSNFTIMFQVKNVGSAEEGTKEAKNVEVNLYDWGECEPLEGYANGEVIRNLNTIYPGGAEIVEWNLRAPSNQELGNMEGTCPIRFKVNYDYSAYTTSDLVLVSPDRLRQAAKSGETLTANPLQTQSRGPLKITIDVQADQPVRSDLTIPVIINVKDTGSGLYQCVPSDTDKSLIVKFPKDFDVSCDKMKEVGQDNNKVIFKNNVKLDLIKGKSVSVRCDLEFNGDIKDMKTFNIIAEMDYTYPLYGDLEVRVKPTYKGLEKPSSGYIPETTTTTSTTTTTTIEETTTTTSTTTSTVEYTTTTTII